MILRVIKKWDNEFALPKWKFYIVKAYRFFKKEKNRKEFFWGLLEVIGALSLLIMLYITFILTGEDEMYKQKKKANVKVEEKVSLQNK